MNNETGNICKMTNHINQSILSHLGVLDWMIWFIAPYTFTQFGITGNYGAIANLHTLQFTVPHALWFSVFTIRILTMDLSQSHCHFNSQMLSSCHSLIPFLPFLQLPIPKTPLNYCSILAPSYNSSAWTPRKTLFSIVKNACLPVCFLAMDVLRLSHALVLWECVYRPITLLEYIRRETNCSII
jgi:hypothetical protein